MFNVAISYTGTSLGGVSGSCIKTHHKPAVSYNNVVALAKKLCKKDYKNTLKVVARKCRKCATTRTNKKCAREHAKNGGNVCKCKGTVSYGARGKFARRSYRQHKGKITCSNGSFGDPIRGVVKDCFCQATKQVCDNGKKHLGCQLDQVKKVCATRKQLLTRSARAKYFARKYAAQARHHQNKANHMKRVAAAHNRNAKNRARISAHFTKHSKIRTKQSRAHTKAKRARLSRKAQAYRTAVKHSKAANAAAKKYRGLHSKRARALRVAAAAARKAVLHLRRYRHYSATHRRLKRTSGVYKRVAQVHKKRADAALKKYRKQIATAKASAKKAARFLKLIRKNCAQWRKLYYAHRRAAGIHYSRARRSLASLKKSKRYHSIYSRASKRVSRQATAYSKAASASLKIYRKETNKRNDHRRRAAKHLKAQRAALKAYRKSRALARKHRAKGKLNGRYAAHHQRQAAKLANLAKNYARIAAAHKKLGNRDKARARNATGQANAATKRSNAATGKKNAQVKASKAAAAAAAKLGL